MSEEQPKVGVIKLTDRTEGHVAKLNEHGYETTIVEKDDDKKEIHVTNVTSFIETDEEPLDVSTEDKLLDAAAEAVNNKQLFTYRTKFYFGEEDGKSKVLWGPMALGRLGELSMLVAKPRKAGSKASKGPKLSALKTRLGG